MKENCYFAHLWDLNDPDFEHWVHFDLTSYAEACARVERWRAQNPTYDGEVLEAFLNEA